MATRKASEAVLQELAHTLPELVGGSGDLDPSTFTWLKQQGDFEPPATSPAGAQGAAGGVWSYAGRNIHFGVREHAMGAAVNGLAYHGGFIPFGASFLVFSDYMRPAIRLAALARLRSIFVFTHDSVGLGEDGPTHQAVEQLAALRAIPDLLVIRPADANETRVAWQVALEARDRPTLIALTRQAVPTLDRDRLASAEGLRRGGYVLNPRGPGAASPDVVLMATGSEVALIVEAAAALAREGIAARLVSLPCWRRLPGRGAAARGDGAGRDRGRDDVRLGPLRRPPRAHHRHRSLRRLRAGADGDEGARHHRRARRRGGAPRLPRRGVRGRPGQVKGTRCRWG
jgi:transketolase